MFSHVTIGTADLARAIRFYDAVLAPLGIPRLPDEIPDWAAWRRAGEVQTLWVGLPINGERSSVGNGCMTAFLAPTRDAVDAAYAAAMAGGGRCEGPPGLRPHYAADYYGAYVRDPDGNKIHFVCRSRA